ncbi:MAG: hypothetical protein KKA19_01780, partial [Candidatus Margulisbacteria bacterium]|nr:hypothetical protein [Candidatus Margulisiibacteriota bacterium]
APGDPPAEDSNGTYQVNKLFRYNPVNSVPTNHDQGNFTREMYSSVTRNSESALSWRNRTSHSIVNRTATLVTYNSVNPPVQFRYIQSEVDNQNIGEGRISKADDTIFNFLNFKITSEINQNVVPGTVAVAGSVSNASYFGQIDPTAGTPYISELDEQLNINYHQLKVRVETGATWQIPNTLVLNNIDLDSGQVILSSRTPTFNFSQSESGPNNTMIEFANAYMRIYDWEGNLLFQSNPELITHYYIMPIPGPTPSKPGNTDAERDFGEISVYLGFWFDLPPGCTYYDIFGYSELTVRDEFLQKITKYDDGERNYRVWIDNGRVLYEQKPKGGMSIQFPVSDYVNATDPAINKIGNKMYITWIQDNNKLYVNVVDLDASVSMTKEGSGSATIDLDYSIDIDTETITGSIHLENNYNVKTNVVFVNSNLQNGGIEEVVQSEMSNIEASGTVYKNGELVGYIRGGNTLTNGDIEIYDTSNNPIDPDLIWEYYN